MYQRRVSVADGFLKPELMQKVVEGLEEWNTLVIKELTNEFWNNLTS